jgi:hypothetical protein
MSKFKNPGRFAGLLYLLGSIPGIFGLLYVPSKLMVPGDPIATARNLAANETLFRLAIFADLAGQTIFIFVAFALYQLLNSVNHRQAMLMLILLLVSIPITFSAELNALTAVLFAGGTDYLHAFDESHRIALMRLFLNLRVSGLLFAGFFWGLWLFPLGLLVYRSRFIPRVLGVLLVAGCFAYLANSFTSLVLPEYEDVVARWMSPIQFVEIIFMLWLLIMGAKPKPLDIDTQKGA